MHEFAPVRYAKVDGESLAYRDCGGSGTPLVYLGTNGSHQDLMWEEPGYAHFLRTLAGLGRLATFDRRGAGLSSHTTKPTIEVRVADIEAVLDASGVESAVSEEIELEPGSGLDGHLPSRDPRQLDVLR